MANSLQQITDAWGNWMAAKLPFSGGMRFTESTNYGNQSDLDNYHQYQTNATVQSMTYDPAGPPPIPGSESSITTSYNNDSTVPQSYTYDQSLETQQTFTWSITEALSVGIEISATEGVPSVAQVGQKVTTNISFSSTQGASFNKTEKWAVSMPIVAPPESHIDALMVVTTAQYDIQWTAVCLLDGSVAIWFNNKVALNPGDYHWLWFIPIEQVFSDCQQYNIIDTTGYQVVAGGVLATSTGTFTGGQGVGVAIQVKQTPISSGSDPAGQAVTLTIPIKEDGTSALIHPAA